MKTRIVNKIGRLLNQYRYHLKLRNLAARNVLIGKDNRFDASVLFDTSMGGNITIGSGNDLLHGCIFMTYGGRISIGNRCSINPYTVLYGHGKGLVIGDNVLIAGHCLIVPANHVFKSTDTPINSQGIESIGIIIEDDVWIGAGCQILDGVTIAKGTIVAAGSVVNRSTEPFTIIAGVPAKKIKKRI